MLKGKTSELAGGGRQKEKMSMRRSAKEEKEKKGEAPATVRAMGGRNGWDAAARSKVQR